MPDSLPWRAKLATWPIPDRQAWGERANALEVEQGMHWKTAERQAFDEVRAKREAADSEPQEAPCTTTARQRTLLTTRP